MRVSGGRGQKLVEMLVEIGGNRGQTLAVKLRGTSAGRGHSVPSPPVRRPEQRGGQVDTCTEASLPLHLSPCIWTTRVLHSLTRKLPPDCPGGWLSPLNYQYMMCGLRLQPTRKKRRLLEPPLTRSRGRNEDEQATLKKQKKCELCRVWQCDAGCRLVKQGAWQQEEYNHHE